MNYLKTLILGSLTALMILTNGKLSLALGNTAASILIHLIGLLGCGLWLIYQNKMNRFNLKTKYMTSLTPYELSGGVIGYLTVWLTNASFESLGVAATLGLAIGGQAITAMVLDHFGLLGTPVRKARLVDVYALALTLMGAYLLTIGG